MKDLDSDHGFRNVLGCRNVLDVLGCRDVLGCCNGLGCRNVLGFDGHGHIHAARNRALQRDVAPRYCIHRPHAEGLVTGNGSALASKNLSMVCTIPLSVSHTLHKSPCICPTDKIYQLGRIFHALVSCTTSKKYP